MRSRAYGAITLISIVRDSVRLTLLRSNFDVTVSSVETFTNRSIPATQRAPVSLIHHFVDLLVG
ncbi:hypothetical protein ASE89_00720 [Sphingomonas sp. Leaf30]|nr:hypothetical protein ASE89_00720 [Sphingomonas sp. Leaf30]